MDTKNNWNENKPFLKVKLEVRNLTLNGYRTINLLPGDKLSDMLNYTESKVLQFAMERCKNNQVACANALGISRGTLRTKLRQYFGNTYFKTLMNE